MSRWHHDHRSAPQEVPAGHIGPFTGVVAIAETSQVWSGYSRLVVVRVTRSYAEKHEGIMEGKNTGLPFPGGLDGYCKWSNPPSFLCLELCFLSVTLWFKILLQY